MIQQLHERISAANEPGASGAMMLLMADPIDLVLHMQDVWSEHPHHAASSLSGDANSARTCLLGMSSFSKLAPNVGAPRWNHLGYSFALENTRAFQILQRVINEYRSGETLQTASLETRRWLETAEALFVGSMTPTWPLQFRTTDPEAVRRNAYWRLFGLELAFGTEENRAANFVKPTAANVSFVPALERLLTELNAVFELESSAQEPSDAVKDRISQSSEALRLLLVNCRQSGWLDREELVAATVFEWIALTLSFNSPLVDDLNAQANSPSDRLRQIGEQVGLAPHRESESFFDLAPALSSVLKVVEAGTASQPELARVLYLDIIPDGVGVAAVGLQSRVLIREWAALTGHRM